MWPESRKIPYFTTPWKWPSPERTLKRLCVATPRKECLLLGDDDARIKWHQASTTKQLPDLDRAANMAPSVSWPHDSFCGHGMNQWTRSRSIHEQPFFLLESPPNVKAKRKDNLSQKISMFGQSGRPPTTSAILLDPHSRHDRWRFELTYHACALHAFTASPSLQSARKSIDL